MNFLLSGTQSFSLRSTCLLFTFISVLALHASGQSITGRVQDSAGKPLPFVNVLLLNSADSTLVKGAASDEGGAYMIEGVSAGNYLLSATMIGYKKVFSAPIIFTNGHTKLLAPILALAEDAEQLKEVTVVAIRPFVEQQIDRTVVNVANSIIASGSTALEVLEKAPGVTVDRQNDAIALRGKDGVIVQIDGKQTYLAMSDVVALLRSMPSDNIDKIELITNPSAKYDAAGNSGIINIRMKKDNSVGTNGSLSLAGGTGRHDRERGSLQINHRSRKLNLLGNYSANRGGNYWTLVTNQDRTEGEDRTVAYQDTYLRFRDWGQNAKAGLDYAIGKNTTIGLLWTGFWSHHQEDGPASSYFRRQPAEPVYLQAITDKDLSTDISNQVGNLNVQHSFGAKGGDISADVDLGHFQRTFSNALVTETTRFDDPSQTLDGLLNQMPTTIDILTFKTDYNRSIAGSWKMETGLKHSLVRTDNNLTISRGPVEDLQPDPLLSNHFQYTERVNAAYVSISGKLAAKTELLLGLRAEHTHSKGNSITLDRVVERDYVNLFPSVFLTRPLTPNHSLSLSYSRRIDRPNYESLNPARSYADPYLYTQGNPYLQPQYTQALELRHGYKEEIFTSLGANYTQDLMFHVIQPVDSVTTERTPLNIGKSQIYNLTISFPITLLKGWTLQTTLTGYYNQFQFIYQEVPMSVQQLSGRINGTSTLLLGKGWTAELSGWINSSRKNAMTRYPWRGSVDAGLQKAVNDRLKAKLSLQDIFHTNWHIGDIQTQNFNQYYKLTFDTRVVMLNLTYSFGNQQLKKVRQRKTGSEEEMQRTN